MRAWPYPTDCASCPFAKAGRPNKPVRGTIPADAVGVLVGEGPGYDEVQMGRPFVGQTGRALDQRLEEVGLARDRLAILNATACYPSVKGAKALTQAVKCCAPAFDMQLGQVSPTVPIFAMGTHAVRAVGIQAKVANGRGFIRKLGLRHAIISWHPSYALLRNPYEAGAFTVDLERFARLTRGEADTRIPPVNTNPTAEDVYDLVEEAGGVVGADIETTPANRSAPWTGLDPIRARLKTIALGSLKRAVAVLWGHNPGAAQAVRRTLRDPRTTSVWHNGAFFDLPVLDRYGIHPKRWEDTRDLRRALSATSRLSLLYLASLYVDTGAWKMDENGEKLSLSQNIEDLLKYNALDALITCRVYWAMKRELDESD